ncbi:MFS transporter, SP family, arabinose:H+ symporter [Pseudohyphozyma bogoriensis]|nr:MFS transporter, SP family, arabinose:H+ symporter [Pseudohyphozyma bogoriensis]
MPPTLFVRKEDTKPTGTPEFVEHALGEAGVVDETSIVVEGEDKITGYTWYLAFIAGLSGFLFGWDTAVIGGALGNIGTALDNKALNPTESEWAVAGLSCGALVGALVGGVYADIVGRKPVLIVGDVCFVLGAVLICASFSFIQFVVGRVVMGLGVGIASLICTLYLSELAPTKVRGRLVATQAVMVTGGQLIAYAVAAGLDNVHNGWRILFGKFIHWISIPFGFMQAAGMHFLPESPRFDVVAGHHDRATKTLAQVYPYATPEQIDLKLKVIQLSADISNSLKVAHPSVLERLKILVTTGRYRRCVTITVTLFTIQNFSGFNTLLYYSSTLFGAAGFNNSSAVGILVAGVNALMSVISMFTVDRIGRRRYFLITLPVMTIALVIASISFYKMTLTTNGELLDDPAIEYPRDWTGVMIGMFVLFIIGYSPACGSLPYTAIELVPLEIRGLGAAITTGAQWAGNIVISATYLTLLHSRLRATGLYGVFAGICLLGFIFVYFCYPEASGLSLEETATLFEEGFGVRKAQRLRASHKQAAQSLAMRKL